MCPWRQLVLQGHERLIEHKIPAGILMGRQNPKVDEPVHVASLQTAVRRDLNQYGLIIIDEAHRAIARTCKNLLEKYPNAKMVGATATPTRSDGRGLGEVFDDIIVATTPSELVQRGFLVPTVTYARREGLDLSGVKYDRKTRDYNTRSLSHTMNQPQLVGDALSHWRERARNRRTLAFCASKAHARHVAEQFDRRGVKAEMIEANTSKRKRKEVLDRLSNGKTQVVTNVACLTEGFDCPALGAILLMRPTHSLGLHLQMIGRGMRPYQGKSDCIILDHADNTRRHGFAEDKRVWSLEAEDRQSKGFGGEAMAESEAQAKPCPGCGSLVPRSTVLCSKCGHEFLPGHVDDKLIRLKESDLSAPSVASSRLIWRAR